MDFDKTAVSITALIISTIVLALCLGVPACDRANAREEARKMEIQKRYADRCTPPDIIEKGVQ